MPTIDAMHIATLIAPIVATTIIRVLPSAVDAAVDIASIFSCISIIDDDNIRACPISIAIYDDDDDSPSANCDEMLLMSCDVVQVRDAGVDVEADVDTCEEANITHIFSCISVEDDNIFSCDISIVIEVEISVDVVDVANVEISGEGDNSDDISSILSYISVEGGIYASDKSSVTSKDMHSSHTHASYMQYG
jgi:hypothetical protein